MAISKMHRNRIQVVEKRYWWCRSKDGFRSQPTMFSQNIRGTSGGGESSSQKGESEKSKTKEKKDDEYTKAA